MIRHRRHDPGPFAEGLLLGAGMTIVPALAIAAVVILTDRTEPARPTIGSTTTTGPLIADVDRVAAWELGRGLEDCNRCWTDCCPLGLGAP